MPSIEDFTAPLWSGTRQVFIPKEKVTEMSAGWYQSKYNLPHKGSVGAWRNGRLHAHDMGDHWAVHLDRVDPQKHSMGHLIADAPLLLFIWSGFLSSMLMAKENLESTLGMIPGSNYCLTRMDKLRLIGGLALVFVGTWVIIDPDLELVTFLILIPLMIIILGSLLIFDGLEGKTGERGMKVAGGLGLVCFGVIGILESALVLVLLLLFLLFWTMASGVYFLFMREEKMDKLIDRVAPVVLGALSFGLGVFMLLDIDSAVYMLLQVIGLLGIVVGSMQVLYGQCAWTRAKSTA